MEWMTLPARLLLSAVFAIAGLGKLTDRDGWREAIADFGVPRAAAAPLALTLPVVELMIAALLLPDRSARWGALAAFGLLCLFMLVITINLVRGRTPNCHCFGQLHSSPIGWGTVVRNGVFALVAAVVWRGGDNAGVHAAGIAAGFSTITWIVLLVALAALVCALVEGWFILNLLSQQGRVLMRVEALERLTGIGPGTGLPVGRPAPEFDVRPLTGPRTSLATLRSAGRSVLLVFTNPDCLPCDALLPDVARWQREYMHDVKVAVISRGSMAANQAKADRYSLQTVLLQKEREVAEAYDIESTPAAVLIGADGRIESRIAYGAESIEALLQGAIGMAASAAGAISLETSGRALHVGEPLPALVLAGLDGEAVDLASFRGQPTIVLFWSPDCGFCQQMLPELRRWEKKRTGRSAELLIVSTGTADANRAMGLSSRILLDADGSAMRSFGAAGTPMGVLVDATGRIASSLAAGAKEVMALATRPHELVEM